MSPVEAASALRVLLVAIAAEGDEIRDLLAGAESTGAELIVVPHVQAGLTVLDERDDVDVVVLDLGEEDDPVAAVREVRGGSREVPIVVLSDRRDAGVGAVGAGAQDCLVRTDLELPVLVRALRFAIERQRLSGVSGDAGAAERDAREVEHLERLADRPGPSGAYSDASLATAAPDVAEELVERYLELLRKAAERESYRDGPVLDEPIRALASYLGVARAHPRDAVEMHLRAVRELAGSAGEEGLGVYLSGGRVLLLELMGHLASYYRVYAWGSARAPQEGAGPT